MEFSSAALGVVYKELCKALVACAGNQSEFESRLILEHRVGLTWSDIIAAPHTEISTQHIEKILSDLYARQKSKPLSRIYGEREFWGLPFIVTPDTLDPRPDTEMIIECTLDLYRDNPPNTILDLGTGTGCILITLLNAFKNAHGVAVDYSFAALKVAQQNAKKNNCAERISFVRGCWGGSLNTKFDLIVSNPPYISSAVIPNLEAEVKNHDPILALDGGLDGLDAYKQIFLSLKNILSPQGKALFEIGYDQGQTVLRLAEESGLKVHEVHLDLAGQPRVVEISCGDK